MARALIPLVGLLVASALNVAPRQADRWVPRLERWLVAVEQHVPGRHDDAVGHLASWPADDLEALVADVSHLVAQLTRSRDGLPDAGAPPVRYHGSVLPPELADRLLRGGPGNGRLDGLNDLLKRAALLHMDIAFIGPPGSGASDQQRLLQFFDGKTLGTVQPMVHLWHARAFLDLVRPVPSEDPTVSLWYVGVGAYLHYQRKLGDAETHLRRALQIFPADAELWLLKGCLHETLASPSVQSVIDRGRAPRSAYSVASVEQELERAAEAFQSALRAVPTHVEARLRHGRVLAGQGKHREAAAELNLVTVSTRDPALLYYGFLFLGAEEEALGRRDAARAAFERAASIFPRAQSPYLALSQLARASADRQAALDIIRRLLEHPSDADLRPDPWWTYLLHCGPEPRALLEELRDPFLSPRVR